MQFSSKSTHSCTYSLKLQSVNESLQNLNLINKSYIDQNKTTLLSIKELQNDFSSKYNEIITDLTQIINHVDSSSKNEEKDEESPASIIAHKIINLNKNETYLLDQHSCDVLIEWIGKETNFELIFRATSDGFHHEDFHRKCNDQGPNVVVLRNNAGKIIGGYSPISWDGNATNEYAYGIDDSKTSFLFSLTNEKKYPLTGPEYAICNSNNHGPKYGGGHDLEIVSDCNVTQNQYSGIGFSYQFSDSKEDFNGNLIYTVEDYEVYKLV